MGLKVQQESCRCRAGHRECEACGRCACDGVRIQASKETAPWASRPLYLCKDCRHASTGTRSSPLVGGLEQAEQGC